MYSPISNEAPLADVALEPGDVLRSEFGRTKRIVVAVDEKTVVLRSNGGSAEVLPIASVRRFWRKIGSTL